MLKSGRVGCFEMVEVNPCLDDKGNKMAEIALEIIEESIKIIEDK
jgi:arginase